MKTISKLALVAASLFVANSVFGQAKPAATAPMNVLLGNATANDTQAAALERIKQKIAIGNTGQALQHPLASGVAVSRDTSDLGRANTPRVKLRLGCKWRG